MIPIFLLVIAKKNNSSKKEIMIVMKKREKYTYIDIYIYNLDELNIL